MRVLVKLLTEVWKAGGGDKPKVQMWVMPSDCLVFQAKFDKVQEQLEDLCGMDDLLTGISSKSKGQILRVAAVLNALFSMDCDHPLNKQLSSASVEAAINFVEVCKEHTSIIGGRNNTSDPIVSTCKYSKYSTHHTESNMHY